MADVQDLTEALDGANLADADAAADAPPPGTITLFSSDGHRFHVDRQRMRSNRPFFPTCLNSRTVSKEANPFFAALWDGKQPDEAAEWLAVYRMSDKYDVKRVRPVLLLWAWEAIDVRDEFHRVRFARVGLLLGREKLVKSAAEIALRWTDLDAPGNPIFDSLDAADQRRLARGRLTFFLSQRVFARACLEASLRSLTTIKFKLKSCRCIRDSDKSAYDTPQRIWEDAQRVVEKGLKPHTDLPDAMLAEIFRHAPRLEGCTSCWRTLDEKLDLLERQWYGARSGVSL
ncbi:hypothetical protein BMF94_1612 [Rhodotorula taiwanensis]|uniref:Uncharacterized protein n=1 Tax=Rhodotorula taiwanensis TaxID=741276 RepID=A0A2S5BEP9_9BASI|nr:hypothetical protein BMF94_1612 [Rhodotorula taiwanensis]